MTTPLNFSIWLSPCMEYMRASVDTYNNSLCLDHVCSCYWHSMYTVVYTDHDTHFSISMQIYRLLLDHIFLLIHGHSLHAGVLRASFRISSKHLWYSTVNILLLTSKIVVCINPIPLYFLTLICNLVPVITRAISVVADGVVLGLTLWKTVYIFKVYEETRETTKLTTTLAYNGMEVILVIIQS